jgi:hypothetical protein
MGEADQDSLQETVSLASPEELSQAAQEASETTRGFSLEQESGFIRAERTLRAQLLGRWQALLRVKKPATAVVDIQAHNLNPKYEKGTEDFDRVAEMDVARGSAYKEGRPLHQLRPREVMLHFQEYLFTHQILSEEDEREQRKSFSKIVSSFYEQPGEIPARDPGKIWKDFIALFPEGTLDYQCQVRQDFDLNDPDALTDLVLATSQTIQELAAPLQKAGQPLGYVVTSPAKATKIEPQPVEKAIPIVVYQEEAGQARGTLIEVQPREERATLASRVKEALAEKDNWQDMKSFDQALVAVNLSPPGQPGEGMFSQKQIDSGSKVGKKKHPWLVFYNARDHQGKPQLLASANHCACDGGLLNLFLKGGQVSERSFKGVAGHYQEQTGQEFLEKTPRKPSGLEIKNYGQTVLVEMPRPEVQAGGDLFTYAALWANNLYVNHMQAMRGGVWKKLGSSAACNFTVTRNPLEPLTVANCWLASPEKYSADSPFYPYRHVLGLTACLAGFKLSKELSSGKKGLPEPARWMSLLAHSQLPDWFNKRMLGANRSPALTEVRNHLFPPTIVYEKGNQGLVHNTVAGTDLPNVAISDRPKEGSCTIVFSVEPTSQFIPPGKLGDLVGWMAPAMQELIGIVGQWQRKGDDASLGGLNQQIETLYQKKRQELEKLYPPKPKWRQGK